MFTEKVVSDEAIIENHKMRGFSVEKFPKELIQAVEYQIEKHPEHSEVLNEVLAIIKNDVPIPLRSETKDLFFRLAKTGLFTTGQISKGMLILEMWRDDEV